MLLLVLNIIFSLSFSAFAYLNLNYTDPWLWIPVYMSAAICCVFAMFEMYYPAVYTLLMLFYLIYAGRLLWGKNGIGRKQSNDKKSSAGQSTLSATQHTAQTRNFFGLLIVTGALFIDYLAAYNIL